MTFGFEMVGGAGPSPARWKALFLGVDPRKAALAGSGAVVLPGPDGFAARRFSGLPRAIVVPEAVVVTRSRAMAAILADQLDPRRIAVLEEGEPLSADPRWVPGVGSVRLLSRGAGRAKLAVDLPAEGILVVFNTFEKGWRAKVDGVSRPVVVADFAFQGVRLPAGRHEVELRYHPRGIAAGFATAIAGAFGLVLCARVIPSS
jgi:hypothetical protein